MREFWNLTFSGLVTGAIYGIMASGLVLTYSTSGIFNFAHGAVAFATAYLYYQLNTGLGVPIVPSLVIAVFVFAPLLGVDHYLLIGDFGVVGARGHGGMKIAFTKRVRPGDLAACTLSQQDVTKSPAPITHENRND